VTVGGKRLRGYGFFINGDEAFDQTLADYPDATSVAAIQLTGRVA
jgi:hypothetical protein